MSSRDPRDAGFVTAQFVVATALSLLLLVMLANVLVAGYARGVVRAALDEGARAGARADAAECIRRATAVVDDLLGGALRSGVAPVSCAVTGERVVASTSLTVDGWLPAIPGWRLTLTAAAAREPVPETADA